MKLLVFIGVSLGVFTAYEGTTYSRCQLVQLLRKLAFPEATLRNWVCLIERGSGRSTNKIRKDSKGFRCYGLFQISDRYCTRTGAPQNYCNVSCSEVTKEDLRKAAFCAKRIYDKKGFSAWSVWRSHCKSKLPDILRC